MWILTQEIISEWHLFVSLGRWDFFYWTCLSNFCQSRRVHAHMLGVIVLIGTLSSNQKDVSPFPIILKKKCSVEFQTIKAVFGTCPCANSQDHLDQFTVSFSSRQKFTFLFSTKLFEFGAYANSLDHSDCSQVYWQYFMRTNLFQKVNFSPHL